LVGFMCHYIELSEVVRVFYPLNDFNFLIKKYALGLFNIHGKNA